MLVSAKDIQHAINIVRSVNSKGRVIACEEVIIVRWI